MSSFVSAADPSVAGKITRSALETRSSRPPASTKTSPERAMAPEDAMRVTLRRTMGCDPRLLRSFVVLAEELHFLRAAERLHIAQPALSQQIKRLEAQLGVRLFDRSRHAVALSEAGRAVLPSAREAVRAADAAAGIARDYAAGERGELRVGLSPGAHYVAQALLAQFARARPDVRVRARIDNSGALAGE